MSNDKTFEAITKHIDSLEHANAERIAALTTKIQDLEAKSATAGAAAEAAFNAIDLEKYYEMLTERKAADDERRMLEARLQELRTASLITESEYESLIKRIIEYDAAERAKAEQAACKHIEEIRRIAEKSIARSDTARTLIHRLQHEIYRDRPREGDAIQLYVQERDRAIRPEALATLQTYLCDPTYPTTAYIYATYSGKKSPATDEAGE